MDDDLRAENERLVEPVVPSSTKLTIEQRIDRLEHLAVLLAHEATAGQGSMGKPLWDFIDTINAEQGRILHREPFGDG